MRTRICILWLVLGWLGCATPVTPLDTGPGKLQVGGVRASGEAEVAAELESRAASDATLHDVLEREGTPDYVVFPSERSIILLYVQKDEAIHLNRTRLGRQSLPPVTDQIRAGHHAFFSNADREALGDLRRQRAMFEERERRRRNWNYGNYDTSDPDVPASPEP